MVTVLSPVHDERTQAGLAAGACRRSHRRLRQGLIDSLGQKHAFARFGFCEKGRRAIGVEEPQVASDADSDSAPTRVGVVCYYDPTTGTFLTRDSLDGVDGTTTVANPYHYADNDPLNKQGPLGLRPTDPGPSCAAQGGTAIDLSTGACGKFVPYGAGEKAGECVAGFGSAITGFFGSIHRLIQVPTARNPNGNRDAVVQLGQAIVRSPLDFVPIAGTVIGATEARTRQEFCGQIAGLTFQVIGIHAAGSAAGAASAARATGTLTKSEVAEIQAIADRYNTPIDVVGSRASGLGRNINDPSLPVGKGPGTRSDIDFRFDTLNPAVTSHPVGAGSQAPVGV